MKFKINLFIVFAVLFLVACGSDNDDDPTINLAQNIAGNYKGYTVAEFKYTSTPMTTPDEQIIIIAKEDGTSDISYVSTTWGSFSITGSAVSMKNGVYTVTGKGKTIMGMDTASKKEYECTATGTISTDRKTVSLVFDVPSVMGGLKITFTTGNAPLNMIIAGVYEGNLDLKVSGNSAGKEEESKVTIKSLNNGKSQITLKGFGVGNMQLQDIIIEDVNVSYKDESYILEGLIDSANGDMKVTGSLIGTIKNENANIVFILKPGSMPMPITATFTSK